MIAERLAPIRSAIAAAAAKSGRAPDDIRLLGVTKKVPVPVIREAHEAGMTEFGESKVQELRTKVDDLPSSLRWHLIGHLQTNKARDAVALAELIHSVDSLHLAQELEKWAERQGKSQKILLQVNVSGESTKYGLKPHELESVAADVNALRHLEIHGLMTLAPYSEDPEKARPHFARLRELRDGLQTNLGLVLPHLSMGMSGDFIPAIEEGSTIVRIGTSLFGAR